MFHQKFHVLPHKLAGWSRLVGQEVPQDAISESMAIAGQSNYGAAIVNLNDANGANAVGSPELSLVTARRLTQVLDGPQTPKETQPAQEWWIPLLFWFNKDTRLAIASVAIPFGQRYINIDLESQEKIVFVAPGNLFLKLTTELQYSNDALTKGTKAAVAVYDVKKFVTLTPVLAANSTINTNQQIRVNLYINNIFVNPEIHDIYIRRIGFTLIRVHRYLNKSCNDTSGENQLMELKWPIETLYMGMRPRWNIDATNANQHRDWHHFSYLTDNVIDVTATSQGDVMTDDAVAFDAVIPGVNPYKHKTFSSQQVSERVVYATENPTIDTININAHGIPIFADYKYEFFNNYIPYTFGGTNVVTPKDTGAAMVNFCLYPGTYQPSGHINLSRAREFTLKYTSSYVTSSSTADLIVEGTAINFLLISDGSAVLRYST